MLRTNFRDASSLRLCVLFEFGADHSPTHVGTCRRHNITYFHMNIVQTCFVELTRFWLALLTRYLMVVYGGWICVLMFDLGFLTSAAGNPNDTKRQTTQSGATRLYSSSKRWHLHYNLLIMCTKWDRPGFISNFYLSYEDSRPIYTILVHDQFYFADKPVCKDRTNEWMSLEIYLLLLETMRMLYL